MKNVLLKVKECCKKFNLKAKEFCKKHKKRIKTVMIVSVLTIIIIAGGVGAAVYSHAKSNMKYSQEQLQKIALGKVPGEVVKVDKELNFRHATFDYEFKIKDKDNMLETVRMDSQYGVILRANDGNHMKKNKGMHMKENKGKNMKQNKDRQDKHSQE